MDDQLRNLIEPINSLSKEEISRFNEWIYILRGYDILNVGAFLSMNHKFFSRLKESNPSDFYIMNAVGSTARQEPGYGDIDFLLLTNGQLPGFNGAKSKDYEKMLTPTYQVSTTLINMGDLYNDNPAKLPGRDVMSIVPMSGMEVPCKKIHHILQRNVPSEKEWRIRDKEPLVTIFRIL